MQKTLSIVNLNAVRRNAANIRDRLGDRFFYAVVKADGYGHGAERIALETEDIADGFCVAIMSEGAALRAAGVSKPVLVLTPPLDESDCERAAFYNLTPTVNSVKTARMIGGLTCHIKINTGMNRYGCNVEELPDILRVLRSEQIEGVFSHLYAPDDDNASYAQLALFEQATKIIKDKNERVRAHLSASGGLLRGGRFLKDGARCGILLYGYAPNGFSSKGFTPALKVYAKRVQKTRFIGGGVGYNRADRQYGNLSVYRAGYADGFTRLTPLGEKTLCMDSFIRDGGGEWELIMGDADVYSARSGTISYETLTSVTHRSEIIYER